MHKLILLIGSASLLLADTLPHSLSMQGYTGLINTPNAQVMDEGDIAFSFNNQIDNHLRDYDYSKPYSNAEDYVFGVGFFPHFELQGRFKEQPGYTRDLSANFKYQIPVFNDYLPAIAVGAQDLGSEASNYANYYIVADKTFSFLRASIGYGYSHNGRNTPRMDGLFGGLEARLASWISVLGEYDGQETHAGARINIPQEWTHVARINATVASNLSDEQRMSFMVNAVFPMGEHNKYTAEAAKAASMIQAAAIATKSNKKEYSYKVSSANPDQGLAALSKALIEEDLENITISTDQDTLSIAYENTVYLHNEIDAIAVVLKQAILLANHYKYFNLILKKSNTPVTSFSGSLEKAADYYSNPSFVTKQAFLATLKQSDNIYSGGNKYIVNANPGAYRTRLVLTPKVTSFVGTELAAFDYQILFGIKGYLNLYKGLDLTARYDIPLLNSDNMDPLTGLFGYANYDGGLSSAMLNYTFNYAGAIDTISAGIYNDTDNQNLNFYGAMDQLLFNFGSNTFKFKVGYFQSKDDSAYTREVYLAKYSYNYSPMDLYLEVEGGKYWYQDTGFSVDVKRYFNDVAVSLYYLQTKPEYEILGSESTNKYVGLQIELPFSFKKSKLNHRYLQVKGDSAWRYQQQSSILRNDNTNTIAHFKSGYDPMMSIESEDYFTNRNRLSLDYLKEHSEKLLDTF